MYLPFLFCDDQQICEEEHVYLDSGKLLPKGKFTFVSSPDQLSEFTFLDKPPGARNDGYCLHFIWEIELWTKNQDLFHAFHSTSILIAVLYNL